MKEFQKSSRLNGVHYEIRGPILKAANQLEWVQRMNVIRQEAAEIVIRELICV